MKSFVNFIPTKLYFGAGELERLATVPLPGRKALIVITSGKSMRASGTLDRVIELLKRNRVEAAVYAGVEANPTREQVMAVNPGDYWDYIAGGSGKGQAMLQPPLPIIAVTTTAGTGTEVDPWTVVTGGDEKIGFGCEGTFPRIAIVDPELMLTVPPRLTAFQGFDALFHAAECYLANCATPVSDLYCLKSVELVFRSLPAAVRDGGDLAARTDVALANTLSGMAESTSCCISEHSLAHAISGCHPAVPHGAALIMVSDAWFRCFAKRAPGRFAALAGAAGTPDFVAALDRLRRECGVAELKMSDFGITRQELPAINDNAWRTMGALFELDPVKLTGAESLAILTESWR